MAQNYLYKDVGIQINALMTCTAWNLKAPALLGANKYNMLGY